MARKYKVQMDQTYRINSLINEAYGLRGIARPDFSAIKQLGFALEMGFGYIKKAFIRISRWPGKLRRKIRHIKEKA